MCGIIYSTAVRLTPAFFVSLSLCVFVSTNAHAETGYDASPLCLVKVMKFASKVFLDGGETAALDYIEIFNAGYSAQ
jgi:hypothetical protein